MWQQQQMQLREQEQRSLSHVTKPVTRNDAHSFVQLVVVIGMMTLVAVFVGIDKVLVTVTATATISSSNTNNHQHWQQQFRLPSSSLPFVKRRRPRRIERQSSPTATMVPSLNVAAILTTSFQETDTNNQSTYKSTSSTLLTTTNKQTNKLLIRVKKQQQHHSGKLQRKKRKHSAISFLEPPPSLSTISSKSTIKEQQQQTSRQYPTTLVGKLADAFSTVLVETTTTASARSTDTNSYHQSKNMIDMDQLLKACHLFEQAMITVEQKLSARDLLNNIHKVENFYHSQSNSKSSMYDVLLQEKLHNIHTYDTKNSTDDNSSTMDAQQQTERPRLVALNEQSCAIGLLWIRRSLQFQYQLFHSLLQNEDATSATIQAYETTLQPYHSWTLQQIYNMAVKSATPSTSIWLSRLGGYTNDNNNNDSSSSSKIMEQATQFDLQRLLDVWKPLIEEWSNIYQVLNLEDTRRV